MSAIQTTPSVSVLHKADTRGFADHGWLKSRHTFSFACYFHPERVHFGMLRVLNDDIVAPSMGFGTHPHDNMEIVSIPISGQIAHKDSTGNEKVIHTGEVQIMSAGSGLTHSEYNSSSTEQANFLQIWVLPKEKNIRPRYDQKVFQVADRRNKFQTVVSPSDPNAVWINQDAAFALADIDAGQSATYAPMDPAHGIYAFVIEGEVEINGQALERRDGFGFKPAAGPVEVKASAASKVLLIEVPMR